MPIIFKLIDFGTIGAGGTTDKTWDADRDYTLKKIVAVEKNDYSLSNVTMTLRIEEFVATLDKVPLSLFQETPEYVMELNYDFPKGKTITISLKNDYTASRDIYIVLILEY